MTFFVTSEGSGELGGNLGGLAGADAFCQRLADAVGAGDHAWRALLSTADADARDRIGAGPWHNARGALIAESVQRLFIDGIVPDLDDAASPEADAQRALLLDETSNPVSAAPLHHDILTGTGADGTATLVDCDGWTSSSPDVLGHVGHSDSRGPRESDNFGWLSAHDSEGCDMASLLDTAGNGRIYCFAAD